MPELPEVETVRRGLIPHLQGQRLAQVIARRPNLRAPLPQNFAQRLTGRVVTALRRRGKHLLLDLDDGAVWLIHLGMSGRILINPAGPPGPHDHVEWTTAAGALLRYCDPRRFGAMDLDAEAAIMARPGLAGMGPEPLGNEFSGPVLAAALAGKRPAIKVALLDQRVVAGLGNIYVCEALFEAGISPFRPAGDLLAGECEILAARIKTVLERAVAAGGSSLRDYVQPNGELGYFQHAWAVYGREGEPCPGCDCGGGVTRAAQGGRSTFYCAHKQK